MRSFQLSCRQLVLAVSTAWLAATAPAAHAASSRDAWVVNQLYSYNHPFAAQLPGELATKMNKMYTGAFAFYRGTAHLFYQDMLTLPASAYLNTATRSTWLVGDLHAQNLGGTRDSSGNYVYSVSDFDESDWGPWTWDIRRMAVSIILATREQGLSSTDQQAAVSAFLDGYFNKLNDFKGTNDELSYRLTSANTSSVVKDIIQKSEGDSRANLLTKYTSLNTSGLRQFTTTADMQTVTTSTFSAIQTAVSGYISTIASSKRYATSYYTVKDVRLKLGSGVGSLGRYRYYLLLEGPTSSQSDDVIVVMKQETSSAVAIANPSGLPASSYASHHGARAAKSMKAGLTNTDVLVGYATMNGLHFLLREKTPYDEDMDTTLLSTAGKWSTAADYMGKATASVHALADKDYDSTLTAYSMDKEIDDVTANAKTVFKTETINFAIDYANQVELDWRSFVNAYYAGTPLY